MRKKDKYKKSRFMKGKKTDKKEIFLVEDDEDIRRLLHYAFEKKGFSLITASSVKEALHFFKNKKNEELPLLCIFDRILPDGDGLEVYHKLKHKFSDFPPSLFLTKLSAEHDVMAGLKEGAVDYITKPFSLTVLMEKALKLLKSKGK